MLEFVELRRWLAMLQLVELQLATLKLTEM
jgi:hypothetical protein